MHIARLCPFGILMPRRRRYGTLAVSLPGPLKEERFKTERWRALASGSSGMQLAKKARAAALDDVGVQVVVVALLENDDGTGSMRGPIGPAAPAEWCAVPCIG